MLTPFHDNIEIQRKEGNDHNALPFYPFKFYGSETLVCGKEIVLKSLFLVDTILALLGGKTLFLNECVFC